MASLGGFVCVFVRVKASAHICVSVRIYDVSLFSYVCQAVCVN